MWERKKKREREKRKILHSIMMLFNVSQKESVENPQKHESRYNSTDSKLESKRQLQLVMLWWFL